MQIRWRYIFIFLGLLISVIWLGIFSLPDDNLHLIACDVGQGDAILVTYKNIQILTDGGPANDKVITAFKKTPDLKSGDELNADMSFSFRRNRGPKSAENVIGCLSKYMPFWDREIEMVILTHPQLDHFGGLIEVFRRFKVKNFIGEQVDASSQEYQVLKSLVGGSGVKVIVPRTGMKIRYDLIYLDIVWPQEGLLSSELNDYSVVYILKYKDFEALLTGDIGPEISNEIAKVLALSDSRRVNYLKVPHHGSKNGLTKELLDAAMPEIAVISVGKNNSYGHPHEEVLKLLSQEGTKILRTDLDGDIEVVSDGKSWWIR